MRTRVRPIDRPNTEPLPLEVEWSRAGPAFADAGPRPEVAIQEGRVRTPGIDVAAAIALLALLLGLYSVTRSAETVEAQQLMAPAEAREVLCPEGQALRGITSQGTAICTDVSLTNDVRTNAARATPQRRVAAPLPHDWCYRVDVIGPSASDSGCAEARRIGLLLDGER